MRIAIPVVSTPWAICWALATSAAYELDHLGPYQKNTTAQILGKMLFPSWHMTTKVNRMSIDPAEKRGFFKHLWRGLGQVCLPSKHNAYHLIKMEKGKVGFWDFVGLAVPFGGRASMHAAIRRINNTVREKGYIELHTKNPDYQVIGHKPAEKVATAKKPTLPAADPFIVAPPVAAPQPVTPLAISTVAPIFQNPNYPQYQPIPRLNTLQPEFITGQPAQFNLPQQSPNLYALPQPQAMQSVRFNPTSYPPVLAPVRAPVTTTPLTHMGY